MGSKKVKEPLIDGLNDIDKKRIRTALRRAWSWSYSRRITAARCLNEDGFPVCEECNRVVPRITIDHIYPVGEIDNTTIERMFVPSNKLRAICSTCHRGFTNAQRKKSKK